MADCDARTGDGDRALARAALAREPAALRQLIERMRAIPRILAAKNKRSGSPLRREDLDDLAQATFATFWRRLPTYRGEAPLESFACQIALYHFLNFVRKRRAALLGDDDVQAADATE